jgi:hypothetical protein
MLGFSQLGKEAIGRQARRLVAGQAMGTFTGTSSFAAEGRMLARGDGLMAGVALLASRSEGIATGSGALNGVGILSGGGITGVAIMAGNLDGTSTLTGQGRYAGWTDVEDEIDIWVGVPYGS